MRNFLIIYCKVRRPGREYDGLVGCIKSEPELRAWAHENWKVPLDASLSEIIEVSLRVGWMLFEQVQSKPDLEGDSDVLL